MPLPARGQLGTALRKLQEGGRLDVVTDFRITAVSRQQKKLTIHAIGADGRKQRLDGVDEIICATGQRPDLSLASELRVELDPWLESNVALGPLIDPNLHSCGTVRPHGHRELAHPERDFYTIGVKCYGRAPTFLMTTGFEQARSVAAALAGDIEAADRVELVLPETGVCSSNLGDEGGSCCGPAASPLVTIEEPEPVAVAGCCGSAAPASVVNGQPLSVTAGACCDEAVVSLARKDESQPVPVTAGACCDAKALPPATKDESLTTAAGACCTAPSSMPAEKVEAVPSAAVGGCCSPVAASREPMAFAARRCCG